MSVFDIMMYQSKMLDERERAMRYYRRIGIEEARKHYNLKISIPDIYKYTTAKQDEGYVPPNPLPPELAWVEDVESRLGARDVLRAAGFGEDEICDYLVEHFGVTRKSAKSVLEDDEEFIERIGMPS